MKKVLILLLIALMGCSVSNGRIRIKKPLFGSSAQKRVTEIPRIEWHPVRFDDINYFVATRCILVYLRTTNCSGCDKLEDTVFSDPDVVDKINRSFTPIKITSDHPDFELYVDWWRPKDVPAVGFTYIDNSILWSPGPENHHRKKLKLIIDQLYKDCEDNISL